MKLISSQIYFVKCYLSNDLSKRPVKISRIPVLFILNLFLLPEAMSQHQFIGISRNTHKINPAYRHLKPERKISGNHFFQMCTL